jgi:hypothetical protein
VEFTVYRRPAILSLVLFGSACTVPATGDHGPLDFSVIATAETGVVPRPAGHGGRDVGFSAILHGRSVWVFGDTFLPGTADDGLRWRSSTWSWTSDLSSEDGISEFEYVLGADGMALQLLPHTPEEAAYNLAHEGHDACSAETECGSRRTPWPKALVTDDSGQRGIIYYANMQTGPGGQWDFRSVSSSVATWTNPDAPATRVEPPLFADEEPDWGSAAIRVDEDIYVYACDFDGERKPCRVARVPFEAATERGRYRFWAGNGLWSRDWREAIPVFDGGSNFSVHYNAHLGKYLAFYLPGTDPIFRLRTADTPQGPWTEPQEFGEGVRATGGWNYALIAHPEFSREGGRIEVLSYTHPSGFLAQETRLVEVRFD